MKLLILRQPNLQVKQPSGFMLMEVLVTVVIVSIGMLGIVGMQTLGMSQTMNSFYITQASMMGNSMAERMRANMAGVALGAYNNITGNETDPGCLPACTPADLAKHDAQSWHNETKLALKDNGQGVVGSTVSRNSNGTFTISINWLERALPNEFDANGNRIESKQNNYRMTFQP